MFFDPLWFIIVGPTILLVILVQVNVSSAFKQYKKRANATQRTGAQTAREILDAYGLNQVRVEMARGMLSDHYDPSNKTVRLSPDVYNKPSIAALGIAAHEVGHAIQDAKHYGPLALRSAVVPLAGVGSYIAFPMIIIGFILQLTGLIWVGIALFGILVVMQLINLPVEFNASKRAKAILVKQRMVTKSDYEGVQRVLTAAAMTYVAATLNAVAQLLYFILIARR
jgi:uncharacterized protein